MALSDEQFQQALDSAVQQAVKQKSSQKQRQEALAKEGSFKKGVRALHRGITGLRDAPIVGGFIPEEETIQRQFKTASKFIPGGVVGEEIASGIAGLQDREVTGAFTGERLGAGAKPRLKRLAGEAVSGALTFTGAPLLRGLSRLAPKIPRLAKFAGITAESTALGGAEAAREGEDVTTGLGIGAAIGGAFGSIGSVLSLAKDLPESLIRSVLGQSKQQLKKEVSSKSKPLAKKFLEAGRKGRSVGSSESLMSGAQKEIDNIDIKLSEVIQKASKKPVTTQQGLFEEISILPEFTEAQLGSPEIIELIRNQVPRTKELLTKKQLTTDDINEIRKRIAIRVGSKGFLLEAGTENLQNLKLISKSLGERVKKEAPKSAKLFEEMSAEIRIRDLLKDQIAAGNKKKSIGLIEFIALIGGLTTGAATGGLGPVALSLGAIGAKKLAESPAVQTGVAKVLPGLGRARRILGPSLRRGSIRIAE